LINPVEAVRLQMPPITEDNNELSFLSSEHSAITTAGSRDVSKFKDKNGEWVKWCTERLEGDQI
jgi:hypothetical protein